MKTILKRNVVRVGIVLLTLMSLIIGMALPAAAADAPSAIHTVQGTVTAIGADSLSFTIQNGNQAPVVVKVTQATWYLVVPLAKSNNNGNDRNESDKNNKSRGKDMKDLRVPGNWKSDLSWLEIFRAAGTFSDIQVGDRVTASVTADGTARQVLIIKAPAVQQVRGTISAVSAGSITITPTSGAPVTLLSNANTKVSLKGYFLPQVGQNAIAVYNRNTMIAQTITIQSNQAPVPSPSATLTSLAVTPAAPANLPVGSTLQFTATATYSNGTVANVTSSASWASSNATAATVVAGLASGLATGTTAISASLSGITSPAVTLTVVTPVTLTSLAVTPAAPANLLVALTQSFVATATYSNGTSAIVTTSSTWASSNTSVATISTAGVATGVAAGSTLITASLSGMTSPAVTLTVVPAVLSSITVTPAAPANLHAGTTQQFAATAAYNNGTNVNVTSSVSWASSNTTVAAVSNVGLALGIAAGSTNITAAMSGLTSAPVALIVIP